MDINRIHIDSAAYLAAALMLLILPLNWIISAFCAAFFHELCHIAAVCLCKGNIREIRIGSGGAVIESQVNCRRQEVLSVLAGPVGSLVLVLFYDIWPEMAICGCIQAIYNLLPLYPLDGGRVLLLLIPPQWHLPVIKTGAFLRFILILILGCFLMNNILI